MSNREKLIKFIHFNSLRVRSSLVPQQLKDPELPLLQLRFNPWPQDFRRLLTRPFMVIEMVNKIKC